MKIRLYPQDFHSSAIKSFNPGSPAACTIRENQIGKNQNYIQAKGFGFKLVDESNINENPKDKADDIVWRLPPSLYTSKDNEELRKKYIAIGESNRMTLKFIKPKKN